MIYQRMQSKLLLGLFVKLSLTDASNWVAFLLLFIVAGLLFHNYFWQLEKELPVSLFFYLLSCTWEVSWRNKRLWDVFRKVVDEVYLEPEPLKGLSRSVIRIINYNWSLRCAREYEAICHRPQAIFIVPQAPIWPTELLRDLTKHPRTWNIYCENVL